jgi:hypothetical protein
VRRTASFLAFGVGLFFSLAGYHRRSWVLLV